MKRKSTRGIIFMDNKLVVMYREKDGRIYYTLPGGGLEEDECLTNCVIREVQEEFGMTVEPKKLVYEYYDDKNITYYFLCKYISGQFGSGVGEEFQPDRNKGIYRPMLIDLDQIEKINLVPTELKTLLLNDIKKFGLQLDNEIKKFNE